MQVPRLKPMVIAATATAIGFAVSGCDLQENADTAKGRELFTSTCGTCHILAEAGTAADVGPDLDAAFAAARASGMDQDTIEGIVEAQIADPRKTDTDNPTYMPPGLLEGNDAKDVAAYVASVAGVPGIMPPQAQGGAGGQVFADNGCAACHTLSAAGASGAVGPNLDQVLPGQDTKTIEQSITDPSARITQGFNDGVMPADFGTSITPADLKLLVQFLYDSTNKGGK